MKQELPSVPPSAPAWTSPYRWAVAARLLRARKINLISILGVTVGVASIIVVMAVMDGFQRDLREMIRGTLSDVIVEFGPRGELAYEELRDRLEELDEVEAVALQRITLGVIQADSKDSDGARRNFIPVRIVGVIPEDERRVSKIFEYVVEAEGQPKDPFRIEPEPLFADSIPHLLVSYWLAARIGYHHEMRPLRVGDVFGLISFRKVEEDGGRAIWRNDDRDVVVSRIYDTRNAEFDKLHIYVDLRSPAHEFFDSEDAVVTELRIKLKDYRKARASIESIEARLDEIDPEGRQISYYQTQTWEDRQESLLAAVNNEKVILGFVLFFIIVVACFTIFATLTMTVVEKTREIGVLRALGATPAGILSIFLLNGTLVGALGASLGYGVGLLIADNVNPIREFLRDTFGWDIFPADIYAFDYIPTYLDQETALLFALSAAGSAMVFAVIPAARAARLKPVTALRYE